MESTNLTPGGSLSRRDKIKNIERQTKEINRYINPLCTLSWKVRNLKGDEYLNTTNNTKIRKVDKDNLLKQLVSKVSDLSKEIHDLGKRGSTGQENKAFNQNVKVNQEICNFFANANLGPYINGEIIEQPVENKKKLKTSLLNPQPSETPLNSYLIFAFPEYQGTPNPLYGIIKRAILNRLFSIHMYYSGVSGKMRHTTEQMNEYLPNTINLARSKGFNPNDFKVVHINKLISAGVEPQPDMRTIIQRTYTVFDQPFDTIMASQAESIKHSALYIHQIKESEKKTLKESMPKKPRAKKTK